MATCVAPEKPPVTKCRTFKRAGPVQIAVVVWNADEAVRAQWWWPTTSPALSLYTVPQ